MAHDHDVTSCIGRTPLVRLRHVVPAHSAEVWLKLEGFNPTGSYKDRMALSVISAALADGRLKPGDRVVEYTGGSTGMALAFVCAVFGLRFVAVSSDAFAASKLAGMRAFGAEVLVEPSEGGAITPGLIQRMKHRAYALGAEPGSFYADQFGAPEVRQGYRPLGQEIATALGGRVDVLCAGVGTGAALMGTVDGLAACGVEPTVMALEPAQSPLLTTGRGGPHRVEGIGVGFAPPFLDRERIAEVRAIDQDDAFAMCRRLAREEGIFGGGSTGLNVMAALALARKLGPGHRVVTLGCDSGLKYLGGAIYA